MNRISRKFVIWDCTGEKSTIVAFKRHRVTLKCPINICICICVCCSVNFPHEYTGKIVMTIENCLFNWRVDEISTLFLTDSQMMTGKPKIKYNSVWQRVLSFLVGKAYSPENQIKCSPTSGDRELDLKCNNL